MFNNPVHLQTSEALICTVQADPDATYTKLAGLPSALIWYQVALLGMSNK